MISLKKSIEQQVEEVLQSTLKSYGNVLVAMGDAGTRACPPAGEELRESLLNLSHRLSRESTSDVISETERLLEKELHTWGDRAANFYREKTDEVKEILTIVATAAGQVGERDKRYSKEFGELTDRLQATAKLNDISSIRQALVKSVTEMKTCVNKMAKDGQESVAHLRARMSVYEARLEEIERIAARDPLTNLANRRTMERQMEIRVAQGRAFCVVYIDLNGFKEINDTLGHQAGDDLLLQFASELRSTFRNTDLVGRWGGDEFIVVMDGDFTEGRNRLERLAKWVDGEYSVTAEAGVHKVRIAAAAGIASWQAGDTVTKMLHRADAAMYEQKSAMKSQAGAPALKHK